MGKSFRLRGKTAKKTSESAVEQEVREADSERPLKKKRRRKKPRKGRKVTESTRLKKGSKRSIVVFRMRRLSLATKLLCICPSHRKKRKTKLCWVIMQTEGKVIVSRIGSLSSALKSVCMRSSCPMKRKKKGA